MSRWSELLLLQSSSEHYADPAPADQTSLSVRMAGLGAWHSMLPRPPGLHLAPFPGPAPGHALHPHLALAGAEHSS